MATWIEPIYDRSQSDVERISQLNKKGYYSLTDEEKQEWLQNSKGCLNKSDLNRIENNIKVIYDMLGEDKAIATYPEIPNVSYYTALRGRVADVRTKAFAALYCDKTVPEQPLNHFEKWNDIERILFEIHRVLEENAKAFLYCMEDAELYCDSGVI